MIKISTFFQMDTVGIVFIISFLCVVLFLYISKKKEELNRMNNVDIVKNFIVPGFVGGTIVSGLYYFYVKNKKKKVILLEEDFWA